MSERQASSAATRKESDVLLAVAQSMLPNMARYTNDEYRRAKLAKVWWLIQKARLSDAE